MKGQNEIEHDVIKATKSLGSAIWKIAKWFIATAALAALYYIVFSLFISTDEERRLNRENRLYSKLYPSLEEKERLVGDVVRDLQIKDNSIYEQLFHTQAPQVDPISSVPVAFSTDSVPDRRVVNYTARKAEYLLYASERVDDNFKAVFDILAKKDSVAPPLTSPLKDLTYARIGASVGEKMNPFYKVLTSHDGLDMISGPGTPVYAAAPGIVKEVNFNRQGLGNTVVISHEGGYETRYSHLADIVVSKGQKVEKDKKIGEVGTSGKTLAPHLHYEIRRGGKVLDPVNYFFADLSPEDYTNVIYMSVCTGQSLD